MRNIRIVWSLLALAVGGVGLLATYLASWPLLEFSSCETDPGYDPARCDESLIDTGGEGVVMACLLPAVLCGVPAVLPRRRVAWGIVAALVVCAIVVFVTVGGVGLMFAATAVAAAGLAASFSRLAGPARPATVDVRSLLARVDQQRRR